MKKYFYINCMLLFIGMMAKAVDTRQIIQISIPKTGTFLLRKCIILLTNKKPLDSIPGFSFPKHFYEIKLKKLDNFLKFSFTNFFVIHLIYKPEYAQKISKRRYVKFLMYRDPRDQIISYIFYMKRYPERWPKAASMSMEELIFDLIYTSESANNDPPHVGINDLYQKYLPWLKEPDVCPVRFEDLIGPQGGGSLELQIRTMQKIATHIGIRLTNEAAKYIAPSLFGDTHSFRHGQIGEWKFYFTQEHKKAFKEVAGQLLIDLKYEKDFNW